MQAHVVLGALASRSAAAVRRVAPQAHGWALPRAHGWALPRAHKWALPRAHKWALPRAHGWALPRAHGWALSRAHGRALPRALLRALVASEQRGGAPAAALAGVSACGSQCTAYLAVCPLRCAWRSRPKRHLLAISWRSRPKRHRTSESHAGGGPGEIRPPPWPRSCVSAPPWPLCGRG